MRKFVKTVAVLALAVSVLSTSAFAALTDGSVTDNEDGTYSASVVGAGVGEQVTLLAVDSSAVNGSGKTATLGSVDDEDIFYIDQDDSNSFTNFQLKDGTEGKEIYFFAGSATSPAPVCLGSVGEKVNIIDATVEKKVDATAEYQKGFGVSFKIPSWNDSFKKMIWVFVGSDRWYSSPVDIGDKFTGIKEGSAMTFNAAFLNGNTEEAGRTINEIDAIFRDANGVEYFTNALDADASRRVTN